MRKPKIFKFIVVKSDGSRVFVETQDTTAFNALRNVGKMYPKSTIYPQ